MNRARTVWWSTAIVVLSWLGCGDEAPEGGDGGRASDAGVEAGLGFDGAAVDAGMATDAAVGVDAATVDATSTACGEGACACDDGLDNDGDGLADGFDPECTGALDDDEGTFGTGIPGDNRDSACQDCFFDGNSGSGNDGCRYATECLYGDEPTGSGACATCEVSASCVTNCRAATPNGCDCFGCCGVRSGDGGVVHVLLGATCSLAELSDEEACPRCEPSVDCANPCGRCELCPGRTPADLPADCYADAGVPDAALVVPPYACDEGQERCGAGLPACEAGYYCSFGCCIPVLF